MLLRNVVVVLLIGSVIAAAGCGGGSATKGNLQSSGSNPPADPAPAAVISISPVSETLRIAGQRQFSGWDSSVGQYDVTWSLQEGAAAGTITGEGLYTAPDTPGNFHLIATSSHNTNLSAKASLAIVNVGFVSISTMTARSGHTATLLLDGRVLVAGGTMDAAPPSAELFTPESSSFAPTTGGMVYERSGHCSSLLPDGRVLIVGGADANANLLEIAEVFDPMTQTFSATSKLNQARKDASATLLPNGKVLIAGGQDSGGALLSSSELYDPNTSTFTLIGNMNFPRAQHTATLLSDGTVLLLGSMSETGSAELFDPASGVFRITGSLIQSRAHHTATLLPNGNVLVLGGTHTMKPVGGGGAGPVSLDSGEIYDPLKGGFHSAGKLAIARDSHSVTLLANGTVLVAGGYVHDFDGDADPEWYTIFATELFDPATSVSTEAASLELDRAEHEATLLNDGRVLITGGVKGYQELCCRPKPHIEAIANAELYQ